MKRGLIFALAISANAFGQTPTWNDAQIIKQRLDTAPNDCPALLSPTSPQTSLNSSSALREAVLSELLSKASTNCLRTLAQNLAFSNTPQDREQIARLVEKITKDTTTNYSAVEFMCTPITSGLEEILALARDAKRVTTCKPTNVGEWKVVDANVGPTGISAKYSLFHKSPTEWTAAIAIDVKDGIGVSGRDMHNKIKQCIDTINPYLKGSDGQKLNLQILSKSEAQALPANKRPPVNNINLQLSGGRSNSGLYAADASCSTIAHEVMHLLGLCDEYDGKGDGYQCRSVPSGISIMKYHWDVFEQAVTRQLTCNCISADCANVVAAKDIDAIKVMAKSWSMGPINYEFRNKYCKTGMGGAWEPLNANKPAFVTKNGETKFTVTTYSYSNSNPKNMFPVNMECECPAEDTQCLKIRDEAIATIASDPPRSCPSGTSQQYIQYGGKGEFALTSKGFTLPVEAKPQTSVLLPVHFERIVGGTCPDVTPTFNKCSQWAYKGSYNGNDCSTKPAECQGDDWMK